MNGVFRVKSAVARDVKQEDIAVMIEMLNDWYEQQVACGCVYLRNLVVIVTVSTPLFAWFAGSR